MHLFNDMFQSFANDLNEICEEIDKCLCDDDRLVRQPKKAVTMRSPRSLSEYNRAILAAPTDANLFYGRGYIRHNYRDDLGAIVDYNLAISLNPQLAKAYVARAISYTQLVGVACLQDNRLTDAISDCDRAIELNPTLQWAYYTRAVARSYSGDNDGAIADFTRCAQFDPTATAYYNLGVSQAMSDLYTPALASLSKSLVKPEIATYYARSVVLTGLGDEYGANRDYSEALALETPGSGSLYPNDEHAHYFRALARLTRGRREEAKSDLQATIAICDRKHNTALRQIAMAKIDEIDRG